MATQRRPPHNPHDRFFRSAMENRAVARDFMHFYLPAPIRNALDLDSLSLEHDSYLDSALQESVSDLVFRCKLAEQPAYLALLVEHQSRPDPHMPVRMGHYLFSFLTKQLKCHPGKPLPPVYGMVFYHGRQSPYPYSLNLADCFRDPLGLMEQLFREPVPLVDVNQLSETRLRQQKQMGIVARALKHIRNDDVGPLLLGWLEDAHALGFESPQWADFLRSLVHYVLGTGNIADPNRLVAESRLLPPPIGETVMTFAEHMEAKGEVRGKAEALKLTATNLLREGVDPATVARGTGLSLAVVKQLQAEIPETK